MVDTVRRGGSVALMLLDLDGFKNINDSLGHKAGDDLLTAVSTRLLGCLRKSDTVARLGGDEFAIVLSEVSDSGAAANLAGKILKVLSKPYSLAGREVFVSASIGITLYPSDGPQVDRLLQNADMALYRAKGQGRTDLSFLQPR